MDVVLVQDALEKSNIGVDDGDVDIVDELRQLAFVTGGVAKGPAVDRQHKNRDREEMLYRHSFQRSEATRNKNSCQPRICGLNARRK
jgi:hypothetical protein